MAGSTDGQKIISRAGRNNDQKPAAGVAFSDP
jgi:hypothetical protein